MMCSNAVAPLSAHTLYRLIDKIGPVEAGGYDGQCEGHDSLLLVREWAQSYSFVSGIRQRIGATAAFSADSPARLALAEAFPLVSGRFVPKKTSFEVIH